MSKPTSKARKFMKANNASVVISGAAFEGGGGSYTLDDGRSFRLTLEDARSLPDGYPKWGFE